MSGVYTETLNKLIDEFGKLPGIGPKTAERLAFYILKAQPADALALAEAIRDVKDKIKHCEICYNLSEQSSIMFLAAISHRLKEMSRAI